ncbi:uncharacterized protein LOC133477434 [Phyllopteryx taeniolatus]|uniref:uncharacterized protein LOC133477434 n=1 Tax=Phyllopteryx taeniolatus TaxID=161469 RepID=UPI002AD53D0D|nr:uncharacterized protein LOC133477434 [Phyllopteryx taeniolatus]
MIVDFRRHPSPQLPLTLSSCFVSTVETLKFLGITVSQDLKWEFNINCVLKKAQQRMYSLRLLRQNGLPRELLRRFYTAVIESVMCSSITVWFGTATTATDNRDCRKKSSVPLYPPLRTCTLPELRQEFAKSSWSLRILVSAPSSSFPQIIAFTVADQGLRPRPDHPLTSPGLTAVVSLSKTPIPRTCPRALQQSPPPVCSTNKCVCSL